MPQSASIGLQAGSKTEECVLLGLRELPSAMRHFAALFGVW